MRSAQIEEGKEEKKVVSVIILLLLVPGMLTWRIADGRDLSGCREIAGACVSWLIHDLVIVCAVYTAFYVLKGPVSISFSADWPGEEVTYSIYDIGFVFQYSLLALAAAAALGAAERLAVKLFRRKGKR